MCKNKTSFCKREEERHQEVTAPGFKLDIIEVLVGTLYYLWTELG